MKEWMGEELYQSPITFTIDLIKCIKKESESIAFYSTVPLAGASLAFR